MKSLTPWGFGPSYLKSFFDDEFFPRLENMSITFPRLDMEDKGKELFITMDIPGVNEKDVEIEVEEDRLIIQGETEEKKEEKRKNFYRKERKSGSFYREIPLPVMVDPKKVKAKFKKGNGTLEITLPKTHNEKAKRVKINIG